MAKTKTVCLCSSILWFGVATSCSTKTSVSKKTDSIKFEKTIVVKANQAFYDFLKKFKILSLPLTIRALDVASGTSQKLNSQDNIFIKSEYPDEIYAYGMLPDTADTYKIIWLQPAEIEVPVLTTFTKNGKKISEYYLGVGGCGSDCGFNCAEFITIKKDLTIFSVDSIKSTDCDTNGNFKPNTTRECVRYKTGKILKSGKIKMTKILKKAL